MVNIQKPDKKRNLAIGVVLIVLPIWIYVFSSNFAKSEPPIAAEQLLAGDLVFWKIRGGADLSGHVAVITNISEAAQQLKISHATNNPKYDAFTETYMQTSAKLQQENRYYLVLRVNDQQLRTAFVRILREWLDLNLTFNHQHEALMNQWDDSMAWFTTEYKLKLQNMIYLGDGGLEHGIPPNGFMCSEAVIIALQQAFLLTSGGVQLPRSLQLDPILCPPSTLMLAFMRDTETFKILGELTVPKS